MNPYENIDWMLNDDKQLHLANVSGRIEQFVCLCPRNETDNCDRKEPCKECETCPHLWKIRPSKKKNKN
jgi:hypothetical protein